MRTLGRLAREWAPAVVVLVLGIVMWEVLIRAFHVERFLLPKPSDIAHEFWNERDALWSAGWYTFTEAFWGFVLGSAVGMACAVVLARFRSIASALMPYFVAASAVPIIAFAPIANAWFGIEKGSKIFIAAVLCFFPVLVNTIRGLTSVRPASLELMRSYAAGDVQVFRRVRVPTALPFVFTALKVASVLAMIGAIVGEYFGGSQEQLGIQIKNAAALFRFEYAWAAIVVACLLGISFYLAVVLLERLVMRWHPAVHGGTRT
jgi:NitT/TauT family transport system permease protein